MKGWRILVFAATWFTYAGFYLTRNNFSVAQPDFLKDLTWTKDQIGIVITSYATVYAIGQVINGRLTDRFGPRVMIAIGFVLTAAMSASLAFVSTVSAMAILWGVNGYAQSIGWSAGTKAMTDWTPVEQRGRIMGLWGSNYPAGHALSTVFAAWLLGEYGWRTTMWVPAVVSVVLGIAVVAVLRNHPRDVFGPDATVDPNPVGDGTPKRKRSVLEVLDLHVVTLGLAYFCIKFVRYTFIFWFGLYLVERFAFTGAQAGYFQVPFPVAGIVGSIVGGALSDRVFETRRAPPATLMLIGLTLSLFALLIVPPNPYLLALMYAACGFFLFGPDMLISGTSAMDLGDEDAAGTVTGIVNGMGSVGGAIQGITVGYISQRYGWPAVFGLLVAMGLTASAVTATLWNTRARSRA